MLLLVLITGEVIKSVLPDAGASLVVGMSIEARSCWPRIPKALKGVVICTATVKKVEKSDCGGSWVHVEDIKMNPKFFESSTSSLGYAADPWIYAHDKTIAKTVKELEDHILAQKELRVWGKCVTIRSD